MKQTKTHETNASGKRPQYKNVAIAETEQEQKKQNTKNKTKKTKNLQRRNVTSEVHQATKAEPAVLKDERDAQITVFLSHTWLQSFRILQKSSIVTYLKTLIYKSVFIYLSVINLNCSGMVHFHCVVNLPHFSIAFVLGYFIFVSALYLQSLTICSTFILLQCICRCRPQ